MRILIIEDEMKTAQFLEKGLTESGFTVVLAGDGDQGLKLAQEAHFDLVLLDIMLPKRDGWSVLSELRQSHPETMCLVLTARDSIDDKVRGLDSGADAYLVKPFAFSELTAQIRSLMRRGSPRISERMQVGDLSVDFLDRKAVRGKITLDLTNKEFALLALLLRRSREPISRALIAEQLWGMKFDSGTNVVEVHIRRLRAKVDDAFEKKLIHTVRGMGYVLREEE